MAPPVALGEGRGDHFDGLEPERLLGRAPSAQVTERNEVSSMPRARTHPTRSGSSTSGVPWRTTASITVHQHTPSSLATTAMGRASSPTWRVASAPARTVRTARDGA